MITLPSQRFISNQVFIPLRRVPWNIHTLPSLSKFFLRTSSLHTMSDSEKAGFYSLSAPLPGNKTLDFADLKGKVVLIVNTASACGFTPQYKGASVSCITEDVTYLHLHLPVGLQALYDKHKDKDFTILGFPCNQVCFLSSYLIPQISSSSFI